MELNKDKQVSALMNIAPRRLLLVDTPRLIDEWQEHPKLCDYVRHEIDDRKKTGQFILTGSANPEESVRTHSGAGRFTIVDMCTISWQELGFSSGKVSLEKLFMGEEIDINDNPTDLEFIVEKMIIGGYGSFGQRNQSGNRCKPCLCGTAYRSRYEPCFRKKNATQ